MNLHETYLGDGLYASTDGYAITLRAPREGGDHYVVLEPVVLQAFERYVRELRAKESA
jgi:hypothetical protein